MSEASSSCPLCWIEAHSGNPEDSVKDLIEECKAHFGTTKDPTMAGYILPDGSMLDFGRQRRYEMIKPHGAIAQCLPEYGEISYDDAIIHFMRETGALRMAVNPDTGYVYWEGVANIKPTSAQARVLGGLCRKGVPGFRATMSERAQCEWSIRKPDMSNCEWSRHPTSWPEYLRAFERCRVELSDKNPGQARVTMDSMSLTLKEKEKEDYDHFVNDAARKIYVFLRVKRDLTHVGALEHLEEYAQWGEIPGVTSPLGRGEPVDNEIRALFGLPPIKGNPGPAIEFESIEDMLEKGYVA